MRPLTLPHWCAGIQSTSTWALIVLCILLACFAPYARVRSSLPACPGAIHHLSLLHSTARALKAFPDHSLAVDLIKGQAKAGRAVARALKRMGATKAVIVGVPNVGKSSLINALRASATSGRRAAAAVRGPEPGVTRRMSVFRVSDKPLIYAMDSPGVMQPRSPSPEAALRLALCGAVPDRIVGRETLAAYALEFMRERNRLEVVQDTLRLSEWPGETAQEVFEAVARRRGYLEPGGDGDVDLDLDRAAAAVLQAFRSGAMGRLTLDPVP